MPITVPWYKYKSIFNVDAPVHGYLQALMHIHGLVALSWRRCTRGTAGAMAERIIPKYSVV